MNKTNQTDQAHPRRAGQGNVSVPTEFSRNLLSP